MAMTQEDLQAAIQAIAESVEANTQAVNADFEQTVLVLEAINTLIAKIEASGNVDFTAEVAALADAAQKMQKTTAKLASDNVAVQNALDKAAGK